MDTGQEGRWQMEHLQQGKMRELGGICEHVGPAGGRREQIAASGPGETGVPKLTTARCPLHFPSLAPSVLGAGVSQAPSTAACEAVLA